MCKEAYIISLYNHLEFRQCSIELCLNFTQKKIKQNIYVIVTIIELKNCLQGDGTYSMVACILFMNVFERS